MLNLCTKHVESLSIINQFKLDPKLCCLVSADSICNCINIENISNFTCTVQMRYIANTKERKYINRLLDKNIDTAKIELLIEHIMDLSIYSFEELFACIKSNVPFESIEEYIRFFFSKKLSEKQKSFLWDSLEILRTRSIAISEILNIDILYDPIVSSDIYSELESDLYLEMLNLISTETSARDLLSQISALDNADHDSFYLTNMHFQELAENINDAKLLLNQVIGLISVKNTVITFQILEKHINESVMMHLRRLSYIKTREVTTIFKSKLNYFCYIYNIEVPYEPIEQTEYALFLYAIINKKKSFFKLITENLEIYSQISKSSFFFQHSFYSDIVNINTLNPQNLKDCRLNQTLSIASDMNMYTYTCKEFLLLAPVKEVYRTLYQMLDLRLKDKLVVIRELIKYQFLDNLSSDVTQAAKMLSVKSLARWKDQFCHISGLTRLSTLYILLHFNTFERFIPDIATDTEVNFIFRNINAVSGYKDMNAIRHNILQLDSDWSELANKFGLSPVFIHEYRDNILQFIFSNGSYIVMTYYKMNNDTAIRKNLKSLLIAELTGQFHILKYYRNDIIKEIDFLLTKDQITAWQNCSRSPSEDNVFEVWEEDRFLPIMQLGEVPCYSCQSYISGSYSESLLSNFDSNKKVVYVSRGGLIVFRAIIRLTKGGRNIDNTFQFAELDKVDIADEEEQLILFCERPYYSEINDAELGLITKNVLQLLILKANELSAKLIFSDSYDFFLKDTSFTTSTYSIYISKSKAGKQYLDSLGGSTGSNSEGKYHKSNFIIYHDND